MTAQTSLTRVDGAHVSKQWGTAASGGNDHSASSAADLSLGGAGAVSAAERVKMNSRSGTSNHHQQQQAQPLHNHQVVMTNNHSKASSSVAFTQITPSIKLGPRISHGDNNSREQGDGEMPVMKLNMHRRGQSGQESFEELPSKKESSSSSSIASAPTAGAAAPNTSSNNTGIQNAPQQQKQPQQSNRFKVEHQQQLPPPTFLAAKISPLRSKSSRAKKAELKTRGKTPPPPPSSAIAASSNSADVSFFLLKKQVHLFFCAFSHSCTLFLTLLYECSRTICSPLECSWLPALPEVNRVSSQMQRPLA